MEGINENSENRSQVNTSGFEADSEKVVQQDYTLARITFKSLMASVLAVLNFEKGILFTIRELLFRPKAAMDEYLKHDRKKLVNPVRFLFFSTAIAALLTLIVMDESAFRANFDKGISLSDNTEANATIGLPALASEARVIDSLAMTDKAAKIKKAQDAMEEFGKLFLKSSDKVTFIVLFFFALTSLLFFRKQNYNFSEHLVVNTYGTSIVNVFSIVGLIPMILFSNGTPMVLATVLSAIYIVYFWMNVYDNVTIKGFFVGVLSYLIGYGAFMVAFAGFLVAYLYFKGVF